MINNHTEIWNYNDNNYEKLRIEVKLDLKDILTNSYNPKPIHWGEEVLHQLSHRVYQELILINKNEKVNFEKLSKEKIDTIIFEAIDYWTTFFNTKNENTNLAKTGFHEFINMLNDNFNTIWKYHDKNNEKIKKSSKYNIESIVTE
ncbi:6030_t:CDS:1, partial [Cetraspora pellucida]